MPLKNFARTFEVNPEKLWKSELLSKFSKEATKPTFDMIKRICKEYVSERKIEDAGGYFEFGFLFGFRSTAPKKDVDRVWERMVDLFTDSDEAVNYIHRCLGTVLMAVVAEDPRPWYYKEDLEKKIKLEDGEIPMPNQYFIGKEYQEKKNSKEILHIEDALSILSKKFKVTRRN